MRPFSFAPLPADHVSVAGITLPSDAALMSYRTRYLSLYCLLYFPLFFTKPSWMDRPLPAPSRSVLDTLLLPIMRLALELPCLISRDMVSPKLDDAVLVCLPGLLSPTPPSVDEDDDEPSPLPSLVGELDDHSENCFLEASVPGLLEEVVLLLLASLSSSTLAMKPPIPVNSVGSISAKDEDDLCPFEEIALLAFVWTGSLRSSLPP